MLKIEASKLRWMVAIAAVTGIASAEAAKEKPVLKFDAPATATLPLLDEAEYEKLMAKAKKAGASRGIAETDRIDEATAVADDLKNLIVDLQGGQYWKDNKQLPDPNASKGPALPKPAVQQNPFSATNPFGFAKRPEKTNGSYGVSTPEELAGVVEKYEKSYATLSPAAKIVAAQLIALKPYRGILYRLRPLAERQDTPSIHGAIISYLRSVNAGLNNLYPSDQGQAAFDYLAKPYPGIPAVIKDEKGLYNFIGGDVLRAQFALYDRIKAIPLDKPVYLDNKVFWKDAKFVSDRDRFQLVGNAEKYAYLASICASISSTYSALAYDWTDLFKATQGFLRVYGFSTFSEPDNMTAKERVAKIKKYDDLFTLLPNGKNQTVQSYNYFILGLKYARLSWQIVKGEQSKSIPNGAVTTFLDPRGFLPFARNINTTFANIDELVNGKPAKDGRVAKHIASAVVAGEVVDVDLKAISEDPPKDLKKFLPVAFYPGDRDIVDRATGLKYRNYQRGNPMKWDVAEYKKFFPGVANDEDVKRTARVLSQSWGGGIVGFPFASVLF